MFAHRLVKTIMVAVGISAIVSPYTYASEQRPITIELNKAEEKNGNCQLTFVVTNAMGGDIEKLAYEIVLFDQDNRVDRMTVFDFKAIANGKSRVRQFALAQSTCSTIGRILVNDVSACDSKTLDVNDCMARLSVSTKTPIEILN